MPITNRLVQLSICAMMLFGVARACAPVTPRDYGVPLSWTYDQVRRETFYDRRDLAVYCLDHQGWFTNDNRACMVQGHKVCVFATAPQDLTHDIQLNALCNGWRPFPRV